MSRPHLRPQFDFEVALPPEEVLRRLKAHFAENKDRLAGHVVDRHVQLVCRRHARNLWTPWLTFEVLEEDGKSVLTGRFAPHPGGWTAYMAAYAIVGISTLGLGFFGVSQWLAGLPADMLWAFPIGTVLLALLYATAFIGQRFTGEDMVNLRTFVLAGLGAEARERSEHPMAPEWSPPEPAGSAPAPTDR